MESGSLQVTMLKKIEVIEGSTSQPSEGADPVSQSLQATSYIPVTHATQLVRLAAVSCSGHYLPWPMLLTTSCSTLFLHNDLLGYLINVSQRSIYSLILATGAQAPRWWK